MTVWFPKRPVQKSPGPLGLPSSAATALPGAGRRKQGLRDGVGSGSIYTYIYIYIYIFFYIEGHRECAPN